MRHRVRVFGKLAENVADSLTAGDRIVVVGTQRTDVWHDRITKEKRTAVVVYADEVAASFAHTVVRPERTRRAPAATTTATVTVRPLASVA
jgi:single-strand DNA-binding protein